MLGLGIGATIAVLALLDAVLLRPLPLSEPDRTVTLHTQFEGELSHGFVYPEFERIRGASGELFEAVAGSGSSGMRVTTPAGARTVSVTFVAERRRPVARHAGCRAGYLRPASPGHHGPRCARGHAERSRAATLATGADLHGRPGVREDRRTYVAVGAGHRSAGHGGIGGGGAGERVAGPTSLPGLAQHPGLAVGSGAVIGRAARDASHLVPLLEQQRARSIPTSRSPRLPRSRAASRRWRRRTAWAPRCWVVWASWRWPWRSSASTVR